MTDISQLTSLTRKPNADYRQAEKEKNTVALCTLATLGCAGAGLLISLISLAKIRALESKPLEGDSGAVTSPSKGIEEAMIEKELV